MPDDIELRDRMVDRLEASGTVRSAAVGAALRAVPRHRFVPSADLDDAYADHAVVVERGPDGVPISTASQPTMVAIMLEQLRVEPGHAILEIGTGSGYNAALLDELAGPAGQVTSVELEPQLATRASQVLREVGHDRVRVVVGDGREGHVAGAPYDRVIVTTGAREVAPAWHQQLRDGGRLVSPVVDGRGHGSVVSHRRDGDELVAERHVPCGFLPLRETPSS